MNKRFAIGTIDVVQQIIQRKDSCGWTGIFRISNTAGQVFHVPDFAMKLSDKITAGLLNGASSGEHNCTHFLMAK